MAQTKQEIIRQIQQGKVQTALEGMVQLSGLARDKEQQQHCVLLQSQLSQLNTKFGMGTFDNKTYQLELNRITKAALELAYELPSVIQAPPQYSNAPSYPHKSNQSSSAWKTWGILLTGAAGVVVLLVMAQLFMDTSGDNASNIQTPYTNTQQTLQNPTTENKNKSNAAPLESTQSLPVEAKSRLQDKFVGLWQGVVSMNGISVANLVIAFQGDNRYESQLANSFTGEVLSTSRGDWRLENDGQLKLTALEGPFEVYTVGWTSQNTFNAVLVSATDESLIGLRVAFVRNN
ncbi:MAG: hypothetical protein ACKVT2_01215 [Saprospiraceae bacterium]